MGQANHRGSYEERKAQAIAEGREKREKFNLNEEMQNIVFDHGLAIILAMAAKRKPWLKRD